MLDDFSQVRELILRVQWIVVEEFIGTERPAPDSNILFVLHGSRDGTNTVSDLRDVFIEVLYDRG